jgi:hypothetical protein
MGEEEWTRRRVSAEKTEKVRQNECGGAMTACGAVALQSGGWRQLRHLGEEDNVRGGPSWAQSKNGTEDLMGHHGEVGWAKK